MSDTNPNNFNSVFPTIPKPILSRLEKSYNAIKRNFREGRLEPSELNGGKFCEAVFRLLEWHTSHTYTKFGESIRNFSQATRRFEGLTGFPDSVRFHIPRTLDALYVIRNKRGVSHLGGDVDPNHMDALFVVSSCDWVMAELVRLFHNLTTDEAQALVESLVTKQVPIVWNVGSMRRILNPQLSYKDKMLILLYGESPKPVKEGDLFAWIEHSNLSVFRRDVIWPCHKQKLIEYDVGSGNIAISPKGMQYVEKTVELEV
ncbi:MAG: hypothetical protein JRN15_11225 [Nitrososphaerota archaeon]|nr:hypothetical protein [Nitrososphaerota archaeon]